MKYTHAIMLLAETDAELNETNIVAVMEAAGADVERSRVKALVAALEDVDVAAIAAGEEPAESRPLSDDPAASPDDGSAANADGVTVIDDGDGESDGSATLDDGDGTPVAGDAEEMSAADDGDGRAATADDGDGRAATADDGEETAAADDGDVWTAAADDGGTANDGGTADGDDRPALFGETVDDEESA